MWVFLAEYMYGSAWCSRVLCYTKLPTYTYLYLPLVEGMGSGSVYARLCLHCLLGYYPLSVCQVIGLVIAHIVGDGLMGFDVVCVCVW